MLTSPSFRETLGHVALRVCGIESGIAHCFASQLRQSSTWGNLVAVRDKPKVENPLNFPQIKPVQPVTTGE